MENMNSRQCPPWCAGDGLDQRSGSDSIVRCHESDAVAQVGPVRVYFAADDVVTLEAGGLTIEAEPPRILCSAPSDLFELTPGQARELAAALEVAADVLEGADA